jgi:hypothetical protein
VHKKISVGFRAAQQSFLVGTAGVVLPLLINVQLIVTKEKSEPETKTPKLNCNAYRIGGRGFDRLRKSTR